VEGALVGHAKSGHLSTSISGSAIYAPSPYVREENAATGFRAECLIPCITAALAWEAE
jgi:hypothetical protein